MPFLKTALLALGAATLLAAPAQAAHAPANPAGCTPAGKLSQPFTPFGDNGLYTPIVNAGLEAGTTGWTLTGPASVVDGNEPWFIGGQRDGHALHLAAGASATTAPICIDETYTQFRLFARGSGELRVEVLYLDRK